MNNLTLGNEAFTYYETLGGGQGACPDADGPSGMHVAMSNMLNTPVEALTLEFPLRALRRGSGGAGRLPRQRRRARAQSARRRAAGPKATGTLEPGARLRLETPVAAGTARRPKGGPRPPPARGKGSAPATAFERLDSGGEDLMRIARVASRRAKSSATPVLDLAGDLHVLWRLRDHPQPPRLAPRHLRSGRGSRRARSNGSVARAA
jgi:hydantoinase/oxoprolinase-like protein